MGILVEVYYYIDVSVNVKLYFICMLVLVIYV